MAKAQLIDGDRWAKMTCKGSIRKDEISYDDSGCKTWQEFDYYLLQCDCGSPMLEVKIATWKGKRSTPDCGCGLAYDSEPKETLAFTIPRSIAIQAKVAAREIGLSQWLRDCVQARLEKK